MDRKYFSETRKLLRAKKEIQASIEKQIEIEKLYPHGAGDNLIDWTIRLDDAIKQIDDVIEYIVKKENLT